jgi:hypothetical protein
MSALERIKSAILIVPLLSLASSEAAGPPPALAPRYYRANKAPPIISLYVPVPEQRNNSLRIAAREGRLERLRLLISQGAEVNGRSPEGQTALMYAARYCRPRTARRLIAFGADVNLVDDKGRTALIHAARNSCVKSVKVLLSHRAEAGVRDGSGRTALRYARSRAVVEVEGPDIEIVSILTQVSGGSPLNRIESLKTK